MSNKNRQNPTETAQIRNRETGLTPMQEKAAIYLASGMTISSVAKKLSLNRCTLYKWQDQVTFCCFFNRQCADFKTNIKNGLFGLADEALQAVRECLKSPNDAAKLKAAMWVISKVSAMPVGLTDAREAIKPSFTRKLYDWDEEDYFDESAYNAELKRIGLEGRE